MMNVIGIGGGTGLPVLLRGFKELTEENEMNAELKVSAIVSVTDTGGSTGRLRRAIPIPAMGDVRNCLDALSTGDSILSTLWQHRFTNVAGLSGHSMGNLILSALFQISGDFSKAVQMAAQ